MNPGEFLNLIKSDNPAKVSFYLQGDKVVYECTRYTWKIASLEDITKSFTIDDGFTLFIRSITSKSIKVGRYYCGKSFELTIPLKEITRVVIHTADCTLPTAN